MDADSYEIEIINDKQELARGGPDIWEAYLAQVDGTDRTRSTYRAGIRRFSSWLAERGLGALEADRSTILAYRQSMEEEGLKPSTINTYLSAVRGFYRWTDAEKIFPNVADGVRGEKQADGGARDALTLDQARRVLADEGATDVKGLRDRAMVNLMLRRGLRTVEVARADIGDIRQRGGEAVLYVQGKGYSDKSAFVVLGDEALQPIYDYLDARGEHDPAAPLFASCSHRDEGGRMSTRSISRVVKERMEACGLSSARLTAHSLRHTAVTFSLLGGASLQEAQAMARHSNIQTTMIYAHNLDRMKAGGEHAVDQLLEGGAA